MQQRASLNKFSVYMLIFNFHQSALGVTDHESHTQKIYLRANENPRWKQTNGLILQPIGWNRTNQRALLTKNQI